MPNFKAVVRLTALAFALVIVILPGGRQPAQAAIDSGTDSLPHAAAQAAASAPVPAFATSSAAAPATFNAAADFSPTTNPTGAWSYGWSVSRGAAFNLATNRFTLYGTDAWDSGSNLGTPGVFHNGTASPITFLTLTVPEGGLAMHPGPSGENAVVRWTAPATGTYQITGAFTGIDFAYRTTTDVAVLDGSNEVFSGFINSYNVPLAFSFSRSVAAGETIDFTVGYGSNGFTGDSTSLDATISAVSDLPPQWRFPWKIGTSWYFNGGPHNWRGERPGACIPRVAGDCSGGCQATADCSGCPATGDCLNRTCLAAFGGCSGTSSGLDFGPNAPAQPDAPPADDSVYAMAEGDVYFVGPVPYGATCKSTPPATPTPAGDAKVVKIRHAGGWETWYLHLQDFADLPTTVTEATKIHVLPGRLLGRAGNTGTCGQHLHVELCRGLAGAACTLDAQHTSWDGQVIDGWTVHADCGIPGFAAGCLPTNYNGLMISPDDCPGSLVCVEVILPCVPPGCTKVTVGPSHNHNPTDLVPGGSLTAPAPAGTNILNVPDISIYRLADVVCINPGSATQECRTVVGFGSLILDSPLQFDHSTGEPVGIVAAAPSVGGIAEQPDVTALPAQTSTAAAGNRTAYAVGGAAAATLALVAAGAWAARRRRRE